MGPFRCLFILLTLLSSLKTYSQINYQIGDTLNVVAINGLNLRSGAGTGYEKVTMLENAERVVVTSLTQVKDSIEFAGHWVKIKSISTQYEGFVFDAFVSKYPVVNELKKAAFCKDLIALTHGNLPMVLDEYANKAFTNSGCDMEYHNGAYEQGSRSYRFVSFEEDARLIKHQFYEGGNSELELFNARPSEAFYLVMNILKQIPIEKFEKLIIDEENLMFPEWAHKGNCGLYYDGGDCYIGVYRKDKDNIEVSFNFPCC